MLSLLAAALQMAMPAAAKDYFVYFGTFTNASSRGIYVSQLDPDTGKLSAPELAAATYSPNFLAVSPSGCFLYTATRVDTFKGKTGGAVSAFAIDGQSGKLRLCDERFCGGADPCYVGVDAKGVVLFVANYNGGSVKSFRINPDGSLTDGTFIQHHGKSVNANRQESAHAHCFVAAPGGRFALACDLGMDKVMIYKYDAATATLSTNDPAFATVTPGSGPRHLAFSPDGRTVYVINEMACTVTVFAWDRIRGKLQARQTISLLPKGIPVKDTYTAAEIAVRPDGRYVYGTVRGHNSVSVLAVNRRDDSLSLVENVPSGGDFPRGMGIDPTGHWLIIGNQKSGTVTEFTINPISGRLTPTGQVLPVGGVVDVKFVPSR